MHVIVQEVQPEHRYAWLQDVRSLPVSKSSYQAAAILPIALTAAVVLVAGLFIYLVCAP